MAGRAVQGIRPVQRLTLPNVEDPTTGRALDQVAEAIRSLQSTRSRVVVRFDLVVGTNKVRHGLGRPVEGYTVTPTVANAAFAHAIDTTNPRPDLEVWITVVGGPQPDARIEVF